ncbi:Heparan-sulfate 6-O-sulfotransferase 1 [Pitangus sulphuratus]|nr:Heparan-sulfate 6-O-sulfotransferase 1 [Pitangus sulphuratus]
MDHQQAAFPQESPALLTGITGCTTSISPASQRDQQGEFEPQYLCPAGLFSPEGPVRLGIAWPNWRVVPHKFEAPADKWHCPCSQPRWHGVPLTIWLSILTTLLIDDALESPTFPPNLKATPRKFYYITLLRDPVSRYLSEWRHVQRGATWKTSLHMCDGRTPTPEELPSCYEGTDWSGCTLQEFMDCPYNLANNRQVRMLADLSLVGCYNMSFIPENKRAQILLESAKKNLKDMAFFGLTEFQRKTQYLFERTFNLKFIRPFMQYNSTRAGGVEVDNDTIRRIEELNDLDMQLYDYAKDLFQQRYQYKRQLERMEQRIKNREERLLHRSNEALPKEETEEQGRLPTEDYMSHIIEKW